MKLILLLLLSITLIKNVLGKTWYHTNTNNNTYMTAINDCNILLICFGRKNPLFGKEKLTDCVDVGGGVWSDRTKSDDTVNPFTSCIEHKSSYLGTLKLFDCRTSHLRGNNAHGNEKYSDLNATVNVRYFVFPGYDRVFSGYGWCRYENPHGKCGEENGLTCHYQECCSKYGYCGKTSEYCNANSKSLYHRIG
ncbi:hypothetical protein BCR32DRAFT_292501 [Anaeromyces robustus]|uniref:Chitin-binding type-1 domain-containing protein n=1 Tax=Anaeromyces robustus TaxID=1754192 RepID=A0A1Y1XA64_9FUNG|nr:hypothetical protein BCR32DRAFT_292501 [Anaeromyces robustus]|eukprot:ORX82635.1 hypothetical protein BCR32DRAFT_292501 [Anaeromyces robustus]